MIIIKATDICTDTYSDPPECLMCDVKPITGQCSSHVICTEDVRVAFKFLSLYFEYLPRVQASTGLVSDYSSA